MKTQVYFASNQHSKTATLLAGFTCWEHVQSCFRVGFIMPDGRDANGIGRCADKADFEKRAKAGGWTVL